MSVTGLGLNITKQSSNVTLVLDSYNKLYHLQSWHIRAGVMANHQNETNLYNLEFSELYLAVAHHSLLGPNDPNVQITYEHVRSIKHCFLGRNGSNG